MSIITIDETALNALIDARIAQFMSQEQPKAPAETAAAPVHMTPEEFRDRLVALSAAHDNSRDTLIAVLNAAFKRPDGKPTMATDIVESQRAKVLADFTAKLGEAS